MSQERCSALVGAVFGGFAMFGGAKWILSATEREVLASSLSETLENAPDPIVAGVSRMSAPVALLGELGLVIAKRLTVAGPQGVAPGPQSAQPQRQGPQSVPVPPQPPPAPQRPRASEGPTILIPAAAVAAGAMMDNGLPNGLSPFSS